MRRGNARSAQARERQGEAAGRGGRPAGQDRSTETRSGFHDEVAAPVLLMTGLAAIFTKRALFPIGHGE
jgi:hypothetical protein